MASNDQTMFDAFGNAINPDAQYQYQDDSAYGGSLNTSWWDAISQTFSFGNPYVLIFGSASNALAAGVDTATQNAMTQLVSASAQFNAAQADMDRMQDEGILDTPLATDYLTLASNVRAAHDRLNAVANAAQTAWGTAKSVFGLSGARQRVLGSLGVAPQILAAGAILALVAFIGTIVSDVIRMRTNYDLIKQGLPPLPGGGGPLDAIGGTVKTVAIAVALALVVPPIADAITKRGQ